MLHPLKKGMMDLYLSKGYDFGNSSIYDTRIARINPDELGDKQKESIMEEKIKGLEKIYSSFAKETQVYREQGACQKGCGFCCTDAGRIDTTTLEALQIKKAIKTLPRARQTSLAKALSKNIRKREKKENHPCPFLMKNMACMIYPVRPFACRRIYSNHICN